MNMIDGGDGNLKRELIMVHIREMVEGTSGVAVERIQCNSFSSRMYILYDPHEGMVR